MKARLAIDFGTSNTVVAAWDGGLEEATTLHLPEVGRLAAFDGAEVSVVPSLIHYPEAAPPVIGNPVIARNLHASPRTFRGMKRYIGHRSPVRRNVGGREVSHFDAGRDFLEHLIGRLEAHAGLGEGEEIVLTVPVEAFEHYEHWLGGVFEDAGHPRIRLIDEPSAAALGYRARLKPGDAWLVFDFGGGTLDVSVIVMEEEVQGAGRRCRVLGKGGADLGGTTVDGWLFGEVLRREGRRDSDDDVRAVGRALLAECERVKEALSLRERADLSVVDPSTGSAVYAEFTRSELEDLLEEHEAYTTITQAIQRALISARERGFDEGDLAAVLMVGGSSLIPSVQRTVRHVFGRERVHLAHPLDAVARGAAAFAAGLGFQDHIQHDYAIRFVSPGQAGYDYRTIVKRGTAYPTTEPVARLTIKASSPGQTHLGIAIFEVAQRTREPALELVFDPSGAPRLSRVSTEVKETREHFWMNQQQPTFLRADPPARKGEPRFQVSFSIDAQKRLTITAVDLERGQAVYQDYPVIRLG